MAFLDIPNLKFFIDLFNKNREVIMVGVMCRLDMKLIEEMHHAYSFDPNFINFDVFELVLPGVVVLVDLGHRLVPC